MTKVPDGFDRNCYETPHWFFWFYDQRYHFTVDLAADRRNTKCDTYVDLVDDSLKTRWADFDGWLWCNPPYKPLKPWVEKAYTEAYLGAKICMLVPLATLGTYYFLPERVLRIEIIKGRIPFEVDGRPITGNMWNNAVLFFDGGAKYGKPPEVIFRDLKDMESAWLLQ